MINEKEFLESMEAFLMEAEQEELNIQSTEDIEQHGLNINNKNSANFFLKQVKKLRNEIEEINNYTNAEIKRIVDKHEEYRRECIRPLENQAQFLESALMSFMLNEHEENNKKSIKLPEGTLALKKQQPKYIYKDDEVIEFLEKKKMNDFLRKKETVELNKKDLKKAAKIQNGKMYIDGVEIPGTEVIEQADKFEVK